MSRIFRACFSLPQLYRPSINPQKNLRSIIASGNKQYNLQNVINQQQSLIHSSSVCFDSNDQSLTFEQRISLQKEKISNEEQQIGTNSNTRLSKAWSGASQENEDYEDSFFDEEDEHHQPRNSRRVNNNDRSNPQERRRRNSFRDNDDDFYSEFRSNRHTTDRYRKMDQDDEYSSVGRGNAPPKNTDLPPIKKNFFQPTQELLDRPAVENAEYLKSNRIYVSGEDIPPPIQQFTEHPFPERVMKSLSSFDAPTPIQAMGWSAALSGKDLISIGQTGSGKTLGYILPGLVHISEQRTLLDQQNLNREDSPLGLVLAPTRELVQQIMQVFIEYCSSYRIGGVAMFGGASRTSQLDRLRKHPKFLVATPGRLIDFIRAGEVNLDRCGYVVLDEADRMLDMGFEPQIKSIMQYTRPERQTLMWSATWPTEVKDLASQFLSDPVQITVGSTKLAANPDVKQHVYVCGFNEKVNMLHDLVQLMMENNADNQAIVFCETKRGVDKVTRDLLKSGIRAESIHGDKSQSMRDRTLNGFRRGKFNILVATEVAARGLDIPVLKCVVNYDYPNDAESYVHRIGRTGRCGNKGLAYTFFTEADAPKARDLMNIMKDAKQDVPEDLVSLAEMHQSGMANTRHHKKRNNNNRYNNRNDGYGRGGARW